MSRDYTLVKDVMKVVYNEVVLSHSVKNPYKRSFFIPYKIDGDDFTINIYDKRDLVVVFRGSEYVMFLPFNVSGTLYKGVNVIYNGSLVTGAFS